MKIGDLVRCIWQPRSSHVDENDCAVPLKLTIEGEVGLITEILHSKHDGSLRYLITFPQLGYAHPLWHTAFTLISTEQEG